MVGHIGDYPLGSELMASKTLSCLCTLCAQNVGNAWMGRGASVGCYLAICRVGGGVTHQQASKLPQASGGGQKLLQGHFSVLDPSMHLQSDLSMLLPCQTDGHRDAAFVRNEEISDGCKGRLAGLG